MEVDARPILGKAQSGKLLLFSDLSLVQPWRHDGGPVPTSMLDRPGQWFPRMCE